MQTYEDKLKAIRKDNQKQKLVEVAMIAAIMSDACFEPLYQKAHIGYVATSELIGLWAYEFYEKHLNTNWEQVLENGFPSLRDNSSVMCWDDAVIDYAQYQMLNYSN